mgnify:CR=1 FL=1
MLIIPAIDIKDGRAVRLEQGNMDKETVFSDDPVAMLERWASEGAERLHVVDLDGALRGEPKNRASLEKILKAVKTPVEIGVRSACGTETTLVAQLTERATDQASDSRLWITPVDKSQTDALVYLG